MHKHTAVSVVSVRLDEMASKKPLVHLAMDPERIQRIDDFRYAHRFPTRSAAIMYLIDAGLDAEMSSPADLNTPAQKQARKAKLE